MAPQIHNVVTHTYAHINARISTYTYAHIHTYTLTCIHTHLHAYIHTYMHTYTLTCIHTQYHAEPSQRDSSTPLLKNHRNKHRNNTCNNTCNTTQNSSSILNFARNFASTPAKNHHISPTAAQRRRCLALISVPLTAIVLVLCGSTMLPSEFTAGPTELIGTLGDGKVSYWYVPPRNQPPCAR